ncbi:pentapeptide repeat-containing protein [Thermostichus vulcanus]|uniref:Pentapeptide repeat-containing protein n=1 Tax=Thermostichus vulcanus str. 'Rupite' TaxID=2813851 RepID=A0ABT0CDN3_THEVL|nr:pentapeptide repeat-containing protein [Thermostichus vulcanus]MCJ2543881.1 pentapeptide repeat-containing protein [Thermostichus vulcanus str. 'Rupite']
MNAINSQIGNKINIMKFFLQKGKAWNRTIIQLLSRLIKMSLPGLALGLVVLALVQYDQGKQSYAERQVWLRFSLTQLRETILEKESSDNQVLLIQALILTTLTEVQGPERGTLMAFLSRLELLPQLSLSKAELEQAHLPELDLQGSNLQGANLSWANLSLALLNRSDLSEALLIETNLTGAELQNAILTFAYAQKANLSGAYVGGSDLEGIDLSLANLYGAYFPGSNLRGAYLESANLQRSIFQGANLERARLKGADLRQTDLRGANLIGADLRETNIEETFWSGAVYDQTTLFPANFNPEKLGLVLSQKKALLQQEGEPTVAWEELFR